MKKTYELEDLDCANCAAKIEDAISKLEGVKSANVNYIMQKMTVEADDAGDLFGQPVNDLALAFVAPLSADHNYILGHEITLNEQIDGGSEPPIGCPQKQGSSCGLEMD